MNDDQRINALQPITLARREAASAEVVRHLLTYLVSGNVGLGEKLPSERKLAEALGVGRSVLREALKSLMLLGLVDARQGDGTYLMSNESDFLPRSIEWGLLLGQKQTFDLVEARLHLEVILAGLAAERRTDDDIATLGEQISEMTASARDHDRFVSADVKFHLAITQASGNATLAGVMSGIRTLLQVWISRVMHKAGSFDSAGSFEPAIREHTAILRAVADGDPDAARRAMRIHMDNSYERLAETLKDFPSGRELRAFDAAS